MLLIPSIFVNGQAWGFGGSFAGYVYAYQGIVFDGKAIRYYGSLADIYNDNMYIRELFFREGMYKKISFFINEIPITEEAYLQLELIKSDFVIDDNYSTFDYFNDSTEKINLHAKLRIPICIEGVEYSYQDTIPTEYLNGDKLHFRRERRFLRKDRIIVEKEEKIE